MDGFINLNKPSGWTSHDCIAKLRRLLRQKKVGHAGTLDPSATGVLPIAIGRATRLLQFLRGDKAYRATIRFGIRTATDDLDGDVLGQHDASHLTQADLIPRLADFKGTIHQVPPSYSAIQVGGKRLYDLARAGQTVEVPIRTVEVYSIEPLSWRPGPYPELEVAIACGSGTYIRAIARDLGDGVGTGATLAALERTESNGFFLSESLTLDELAHQVHHQKFVPCPPAMALQHLPAIHLQEAIAHRWRMGQKVAVEWQDINQKAEHASLAEYASLTDEEQNTGEQKASHQEPSVQGNVLCVFDEGDRFLGIGELTLQVQAEPNEQICASVTALAQPKTPQTNPPKIDTPQTLLRPRMVFLPA